MPLAVLTAHGQPSAPAPPETALAELAAHVASHLPGWEVRSATLSTPERLEHSVQDGAVIYPFFMAKGWFTADVLPKRLTGYDVTFADPFGLDPTLPACAAKAVIAQITKLGWSTKDTEILLAAHGSARGPRAARAAQTFAKALSPLVSGAKVSCGFVEESPTVAEASRGLSHHALCLPFFAQAGDHVRNDIPAGLEAGGFQGHCLPVVGALPGVPALIARAIQKTSRKA